MLQLTLLLERIPAKLLPLIPPLLGRAQAHCSACPLLLRWAHLAEFPITPAHEGKGWVLRGRWGATSHFFSAPDCCQGREVKHKVCVCVCCI
ncbi:hypothetical protein FKM82_030824 [Ascaphus truei]